MRAASPDELTEHAQPVMTANLSEEELDRWFPFPFEEITDPWAAAEPSKGGLIRLETGESFVVYWGRDSGELTVRVPGTIEPSAFLAAFFREVPLLRDRVTWVRNGVELPKPFRVLTSTSCAAACRSGAPASRSRSLA